MTATATDWWRNLRGGDLLLNLHGDPPYDVDAVAFHLGSRIGIPSNRKTDPLIEVGSGAGRLQRAMVRRGWEVVGVDVNPVALAVGADAGSLGEQVSGDGTLPKWPDATATGAYSVTVFQHLPEEIQRRYLAELARVLRPRARIVIQHVEGTEVGPQSRQVQRVEWCDWVADAGLAMLAIELGPDGWTWFTMMRP